MKMITRRREVSVRIILFAVAFVAPALAAAQQSEEDLAKAAQNPIASLISVPIQSNNDFDWGPEGEWFSVNNVQPVIPIDLNDDWNLVTRTILPIISQPGLSPGQSRETGIGDTLFTAFFAPKDTGKWIWGVGPVIQLPTASDDRLGADEWGAGVSFVALTMPGKWVVGGLVSNVWGISTDPGNEINLFTFQPFVNYNLEKGWYMTTSPIISHNAEAAQDLLAVLEAATSLKDLSPLKSIGLHKLKGDRKGQWAMTVNGPWRICFRFRNGDAYEVDIVDYHRG